MEVFSTLRVEATRVQDTLQVAIDIAPGWHINAHKPLQDNLIGTSLSLANGHNPTNTDYPKPVVRKLGFQRAKLALYEDAAVITTAIPTVTDGRSVVPVLLTVQACSDEVYLALETITLNASLAEES